jgi:hypothetical protein
VSDNDKQEMKIEDLPVPLKDLDPEEQEEVKGGFNPTRPSNPNPTAIVRPKPDSY